MMREGPSIPIAVPFVVVLAALVAGCDTGPAPGVSPIRPSALSPSQPESVSEVVMILPATQTPLQMTWERVARLQAGRDLVFFSAERPAPGSPPERQAELIQAATDRGVGAMVVLPEESEAVSQALEAARDRGITVVLLERSVAVSGEPLPLVRMTSP